MDYVYSGENLTIQNAPQDYGLRAPVILGNLRGVSATAVKKGDPLTLITRGVFEVEKAEPAEPITAGQPAFLKFLQGRPVFTAKPAKEGQWRFGVFASNVPANQSSGCWVMVTPVSEV